MGTTIGDDFVKKSEAKEDFVEKERGNPLGGDGFLGRAKNHPLSKPMVDHDQERIEAGGDGEISDEVAGDLLEGAGGDGFDGRQGGHGGVCISFILLAKGTALHVSADKGGEPGPPKFGGDKLAGFQEAGVAGGLVVMAAGKNGSSEGIVRRDVDAAFVGEDARFDLPVSEAGTEGERDIFLHGLESLEDEGVTRRRGFNALREGGVNDVDKEGRRQVGGVGIVGVVCGEKVGAAGEGIRTSKEFSGYMDHFKVEVGEVNEPARLAAVKRLGLAEVGEVFVVREDLHGEGGAMEIVVPGF